jgi:hypothetical protein
VCLGEGHCGLGGILAAPRIRQQGLGRIDRLGQVGHPPRRARLDRQAHRIGKIEGVRAHQHGAAAGAGLDQVLAAQGSKLPPAGHPRQAVAAPSRRSSRQPDIGLRRQHRRGQIAPLAAPRHRQAGLAEQRGHLLEALRVARHASHWMALLPERPALWRQLDQAASSPSRELASSTTRRPRSLRAGAPARGPGPAGPRRAAGRT